MNIISEHGYRQDGRKLDQIRNINYRLGVYCHADGSAYLEQGNTKVLCAVYGPHDARQRNRVLEDRCIINCQYSMATFSTVERKERPRGDRRSLEFARLMEKAFESAILTKTYPCSQIDIFCELLEADGSQLAACVNAASLALADAGVPVSGIVAAATCACSIGGVPCVDVSAREEFSVVPKLTVATLVNRNQIVLIELENRIHNQYLETIIDSACDACDKVRSCLETAITLHISSSLGVGLDDAIN